jgi:hypothetical protein
MVMVLALVQLIDGFTALKMVATQNARLLKLRQHTVHRGQADVGVLSQQMPKYILGRHVPLRAGLKDLQNLQARQRHFQAGIFEFV